MRLTVITILTVLCLGCGNGLGARIDSTFLPYVTQFEQDAAYEGKPIHVSVNITFGATADGTGRVGFCNFGSIVIDKTYWNSTNEDTRTVLLYHELGHCALGREHKNDTVEDSKGLTIAASIMSAYLDNPSANFSTHKSYYIHELFNN